jgi:hypothetical protein
MREEGWWVGWGAGCAPVRFLGFERGFDMIGGSV